MDIIDLVAMGLLKEMQDETLTITRKDIPEFADSVHIACWDGLTEKDQEFWREKAHNLPVSKEGVCFHNPCDVDKYYCERCDGKGIIPPKTLKQLIEGALNG